MTTQLNRRDLIRLGLVSTAGLGLAPLLAACATQVQNAASQPPASATVKATPKPATVTVQDATGQQVLQFTTGADGQFQINLAPGTFLAIVVVSADHHEPGVGDQSPTTSLTTSA